MTPQHLSRWISRLLRRRQRSTALRGLDDAPGTFVDDAPGTFVDRDDWGLRAHGSPHQQYELWLWWPPGRPLSGSYTLIRWLRNPPDSLQPLNPLAALGDGPELTVLTPAGIRGRLVVHLAQTGTEVTNGQPLARIIADEPGAFEPAAAYVSGSAAETTIVARLMSLSDISKLAAVGALTLVGAALALGAMITFIMVGGLLAPTIAVAAMAVVTACLRLGEYLMEEPRR